MPASGSGPPGPPLPPLPNGKMGDVLTDMAYLSAVCGESQLSFGSGVYGINDQGGIGVNGQSQTGTGVYRRSPAGTGVRGLSTANRAVGFLGGVDPQFNQNAGVYGH